MNRINKKLKRVDFMKFGEQVATGIEKN